MTFIHDLHQPDDMAKIKEFVTENFSKKHIILPDFITEISASLFSGMEFESITLHDKLTHIGPSAFHNCKNLKSITIPDSVRFIGSYAFSGCESLESCYMPRGISFIDDGVFAGCKNLCSINLPDDIKIIPWRMFEGCGKLREIKIPKSVSAINDKAFARSGIDSVDLPFNLSYIGDGAFAYCKNIKHVTVPEFVRHMGEAVFYECTGLEDAEFKALSYVPKSCFGRCSNLKSFTGKNVIIVNDMAFSDCENLADVVIENNCEPHYVHEIKIGPSAFSNCSSLTDFEFAYGLSEIGAYAFAKTGLERAVLPKTLVKIDRHAFMHCHDLAKVDMSDCTRLYLIGRGAFSHTDKLTDLAMPDEIEGVCMMGERAFCDCGAKTVYIPQNMILSPDGWQFADCEHLDKVVFMNEREFVPRSCFHGCKTLNNNWIEDKMCIHASAIHNRWGTVSEMLADTESEKNNVDETVFNVELEYDDAEFSCFQK